MADIVTSATEVVATGKETLPPPAPVNQEFSNSRMRMFSSAATKVTPDEWRKGDKSNSNGNDNGSGQPATGNEAPKPNSGATGEPATEAKQDSTPAPKEGEKSGEAKPAEKQAPSGKTVELEKYSKLQSEHDSLKSKYEKEITEYKTNLEKIDLENKTNKELIDSFRKDPVGFINQNLPELGTQLQQAGDPVKMIGDEVTKFKKELDTAFKKQFGEEWKFNESESVSPDSPSFRYKLAIDIKTKEAIDKQRNYIGQAQTKIEQNRQRMITDKSELAKEFGFTDDDFKKAEEFINTNQVSYKNLVKMAMIDKIIELKVSSIVLPLKPGKDITDAGGNQSSTADDKGAKISKEGMSVLNRIGVSGRR